MEFMAKVAICKTILDAEFKSNLYTKFEDVGIINHPHLDKGTHGSSNYGT